ncbi:MAG: DNA mismatch repair endonuclease MutL [Treponema sp.]|jgi:DNA mismatch repair protein MutL|nr:DNA mismatch repair endonuclease MutL [Treponema sp.]
MMGTQIRVLPPEEAKKIAAGEVIDRPAALVRELIDNALDAGASTIELSIEGGGIRKIEVSDNGEGMTKGDLELCTTTYATSKIRSLEDLSKSLTLGFRGEALAAAAAAARLEILSSPDGREAWLLETDPLSSRPVIKQSRRSRGTSVRAFGIFDTIPARRRFLKRELSEGNLCRLSFVEKALAFPHVTFRFVQDGSLKLQVLPQGDGISPGAYKNRFGELAFKDGERSFLHQVSAAGKGFTVTAVFGGGEVYRRDRRQQFIFANGRRIQDFSLQQALEYGLTGLFPNGTHPAGAVFVEIDPALADFNIHPAKREARFADAGAIHHAISGALRNYVGSAVRGRLFVPGELSFPPDRAAAPLAAKALLEKRYDFAPLSSLREGPDRPLSGEAPGSTEACGETERERTGETEAPGEAAEKIPEYGMGKPAAIRLVGRTFGLFIIVEKEDRLYIIDQHAAHERLLYNRFLSEKIVKQELLVAIPFSTAGPDEDGFLHGHRDRLAELGIVLEDEGGGAWRIEALPAGWKMGDRETVEALLSLRDAGGNIAERWAAALSCSGAVKDGDLLDDQTALALAEAALSFPLPRCPHGRPLWTEISREDLFRAVRRI